MNETRPREAVEAVSAPEAGQPPLPDPVKRRWHPLRCGLINLYRYDIEEFWFEQGRMLLRGNNGTGKSRVLALQLPFLLDGEISPHRVEPDRDPAKRMEWNLLMNRYPDRLGYTWIEFGRRDADGQDHFLTLGCGMRAVQGRGVDDRWFFITPERVGRGLFLVTEGRNPLRRERLEEAVGRDRVYRNARDYRRAVDDALFRLGPRYEPLIEPLIRLRQPQLSRQLDERVLSQALSDALAPLAPALVEDTAEAFRGLEADREELAAVRATHAAVEQFRTSYRVYIRAAARRRADAVRSAHSAYESAARRIRDATEARDDATRKCAASREELAASEQRQVALVEELRTLRESPEMRDARELELARQQSDRCEQTRQQTERDARQAAESEARLRSEFDEVTARQQAIEHEVDAAMANLSRLAAAAAFATQHAACLEAPTQAGGGGAAPTAMRRGFDVALERRAAAIAQLRRLQQEFAVATQELAGRERAVATAGEAVAALRLAHQDARQAADEAAEALFGSFTAWRESLDVLALPATDGLRDAFADWVERSDGANPLRVAAENAQREAVRALTSERTRVELAEQEIAARIHELQQTLERLERGAPTPPPSPYTRTSSREGRSGAPFWKLCDFRPDVAEERRAGIEAALEASGLLDAWVQPDGSLVDPNTEDAWILPASEMSPDHSAATSAARLDRLAGTCRSVRRRRGRTGGVRDGRPDPRRDRQRARA